MRRHRGGAPPSSDESSSDEDDPFSRLSRKKKKVTKNCSGTISSTKKAVNDETKGALNPDVSSASPPESTPKAETSSNKRHHFHSTARAAKMEALLQELQETSANPKPASERPPPDKMGSFVMPGEEQFTTNIFVGNLAPITTEEELTEVFRQFGETYVIFYFISKK